MTAQPWALSGYPGQMPQQPIPQQQTGFLPALQQLGAALQPLGQMDTQYRNNKIMLGLLANRPELAQILMNNENDRARIQSSLTTGAGDPSNVREYKYWQSLTPEQKREFLNVKRANQVANLGGSQVVLDQFGNVVQEYAVTPKPEDMPDFRREVASQTAQGAAEGDRMATSEKKAIEAGNTIDLIKEAEQYLPKATSGVIDQFGNYVSRKAGSSTEASQADARLRVISAALTSSVPRFEGPQGVLDVELYKQAAGDVANTELPYEDRLAAIDTMKTLQEKYAKSSQGNSRPSQTKSINGITYYQDNSGNWFDSWPPQ